MRRKVFLFAAAALAVALLWCAVFLYTVRPAWFASRFYAVRGVDVSRYQGEIDWGWLSRGLSFAFIKATEGASTIDPYFALNFENAAKTGLVTGAYHFFDLQDLRRSPGGQFHLGGGATSMAACRRWWMWSCTAIFPTSPPSLETVRAILDPLLRQLETRYGAKADPVRVAAHLQTLRTGRLFRLSAVDPQCQHRARHALRVLAAFGQRAAARLFGAGEAHRPKRLFRHGKGTSRAGDLMTADVYQSRSQKQKSPAFAGAFWCRKRDLNPHGVATNGF